MDPRKGWAQWLKVKDVLHYMFNKAKPLCLTEICYGTHDVSEDNVHTIINYLIAAGMVKISHKHLRNTYYKLTELGTHVIHNFNYTLRK